MKRSRFSPLLFAVVCLAVAGTATGCGKKAAPSAPSPPSSQMTQQAADDLARQFAVTLSRQGGVPLNRVGSTSLQDLARGQAPVGNGTRQADDEGSFSWSFTLRYFDAAGNEQVAYDPATTVQVKVSARARGSFTSAEHRATVGIDRQLDVRGLLPDETTLTINGAANDTADCVFDASDGSASRTYHFLGLGALNDVMQLKDESVNPYPLSGTARWEVNVDAASRDANGTSEAHYRATVLVTFNGTKHPTIEISETYRYQMDLETGEIERLPA